MGEILLAFTIITLTFIVFYLKTQRTKKKTSSEIDESHNVIMKTPKNCAKSQTTNINDRYVFNGTTHQQNNQFSGMNSPFISSNPSFIKIKNINYNNINQVSPINNYSYVNINDNLTPLHKSHNKNDSIDSFIFNDNLSRENYESFEKKIKSINLVNNEDLVNNDKLTNKNDWKFEVEGFNNNKNCIKMNNTEKKLRINNIVFTQIDFDYYRKALNSEKKKTSTNSLSKNISYYGVKTNRNKVMSTENSFDPNTEIVDDSNNSSIEYESIIYADEYHRKQEIYMDSPVKKKLSFNTNSRSNFDNNPSRDILASCSKKISTDKRNISQNMVKTSKILEKLMKEKNNRIENLCNETDSSKEPIISLNSDSASTNFQNIYPKIQIEKIDHREKHNINNKNKVSSNLINSNNSNNKKNNLTICDDELEENKNNDCLKTNILYNISDNKMGVKNRECLNENKENDKNFSNKCYQERSNPMFLDLIPKKRTNHNVERTQELITNMNKKANNNNNNNLSSIREEERSIENHSSNSFLKGCGDSAKNISFGSDNKNFVRKNNPITSTFILSSCLKEN